MKRLFGFRALVILLLLPLVLVSASVSAAQPIRKVGIFPGSFDPFHIGHMKVAQEALDQFRLDEVIIVPNATNVRKPGMSSLEFRWKAIQRALWEKNDPRFALLPMELIVESGKAGLPEMAPQRLLEAAIRSRAGSVCYQILGSDSFTKLVENRALPRPGEDRILVISMRPGEPLGFPSEVARLQKLGLLHCIPEPNMDISSTKIRTAAREGNVGFISAHLPAGTWRYVLKEGAYGLYDAPGWGDALLEIGPDPISAVCPPEALSEGWMKDFSLKPTVPGSDTFPLELPDSRVEAIDFEASHTLDLQGYLQQRLTPLGMRILERPDVEVYLVRGPRERLSNFLNHLGVIRAIEVTRPRSYITLGIVLGRRSNGRMIVAIGDVWGRERDLHTQALIGGALAIAGRPSMGFRVVAYPNPEEGQQFLREEFRRVLHRIVPNTIDTVVIGYHWKVLQQLNWRLHVSKKFPSRWSMSDGRISTTWRFRIDKVSPTDRPQEGWARKYFDHASLPFSLVFYRDSLDRPRTFLLTRNVYGDQLRALLEVLVTEKKVHRLFLFGSCGALGENVRVGDLVLPAEVSGFGREWKPLDLKPWSRQPRWLAGRLSPTRVYSVFSPLEETAPFIENLNHLKAGAVDVEMASLQSFLESRAGKQTWTKAMLVVSDLPGRGSSLEMLSDRELELEPAFIEMTDFLVADLDISGPSDHTVPLND